MPTFDLVVGQSYPVSNGTQSGSLEFLGMIGRGRGRALLFDNPNFLGGVNYPYVAATPEVIYPAESTSTITIEIRLRARLVGQTATNLTRYNGPDATWVTVTLPPPN